ncbi:MAG: prepilin-type N-terminal cleavage/methylation domain-containing protein [Candidatus Riflebacteria bacterium]|nr:prepilin-type N-terminal cleavage/methylation domain-containing protein [Candidatus Riflebacteria bacterium]
MNRRRGLSLLEIVIAAAILSAMVVSAFDLLSMQRREVAASERALLLHAYAVQRLAEEESRLNVVRFASAPAPRTTTSPPGESLPFTETMSAAPMADCTGLWRLTIALTYAEGSPATARTVSLSRLIVDRDLLTRLPASTRGHP